jgi:hypothetical protein
MRGGGRGGLRPLAARAKLADSISALRADEVTRAVLDHTA